MSAFVPTPEQAAIIDAPIQDDVLVVAGAGSGKTFTMTQRIIALINRGVSPERILGLTFTRKAAGELLDRVSAAVNVGRDDDVSGDRAFLKPSISTYDAFFQTIVRQYGLLVGFDQNTQPLSRAGALQLATNVIDEYMNIAVSEDFGSFSNLANSVLALSDTIGSAMIGTYCTGFDEAIERVRSWDNAFIERLRRTLEHESMPESEPSCKPPKHRSKDTDADWQAKLDDYEAHLHARCVFHCGELLNTTRTRNVLLDLVEAYAKAKRELNMAEFSDFTIAAYQLVERFDAIGERIRRRYSHVLLDEYQDTSTTQAGLLQSLFHPDDHHRSSVNAVGDPFQSIYAFRGASPGAFRMFQHDFHMSSDSKPFPLSVTRRNSRVVLDTANDLTLVLRNHPARPSSSLMREVDVAPLSPMPDAPEGTLGVLGYATGGQEIDAVVRYCVAAVKRYRNADGNGASVAVLMRNKRRMPLFQDALERAGLTTFAVGYSALLERPEIHDLLALLRVAADHTDAGSLMRLLATPRFHVGASDLTIVAGLAERLNTEQQFHALVQAGLAPADAAEQDWPGLVREHRDQVANAVFLPDLLLRDDLDAMLGGSTSISGHGKHAIVQASRALKRVRATVGHPLVDVVRAAIDALDLDIDTVLAGALRDPNHRIDATRARMPLETVVELVDVYAREIAIDQTPTLRGFMAWVDHLASVEDEAAKLPDASVDVELLTVHQSKGLEWDAVAVVGMTEGAFPSSKGDRLSITVDEDHAGGVESGRWQAPEYHETARTWLSDPTAVPAPMRVDADILPRFPHDWAQGTDPIAALDVLDEPELIDDEVFGSMRDVGDGVDDVDPAGWYLTQEEEYGRRLHADERRLAYVALTRARKDVLMTYSVASTASSRDPQDVAGQSAKAKPSVFWLEVHDAMRSRAEAVTAASCVESLGESVALRSLDGAPVAAPEGFWLGEHARDYAEATITEAWRTANDERDLREPLVWPGTLSEALTEQLNCGVDVVRALIAEPQTDAGTTPDTGAVCGRGNAVGSDGSVDRKAAGDTATGSGISVGPLGHRDQAGKPGPLLQRAQLLVADDALMADSLDGAELDAVTEAKAKRILAVQRQNVTSLQARVGGMSEREERDYWRGIVRPIPRVASPLAEAGTQFHDWAERFVKAGMPDAAVMGESDGMTRATMLAELDTQDRRLLDDATKAKVATWCRRLADSPWARRVPAWAERSVVVDVPGVGLVNGKFDAVFLGGCDPADRSKRFCVVDWKTGKRPMSSQDVERKLSQLDMYRLLLAAIEDVPLDSIDATLYYVSESDEGRRELHARAKTEQEILAELSYGIPEQSDND